MPRVAENDDTCTGKRKRGSTSWLVLRVKTLELTVTGYVAEIGLLLNGMIGSEL